MVLCKPAPDLGGAKGARAQDSHHVHVFGHMHDMRVPHTFFISEESLFRDAFIGRPDDSISLVYYLIL